jgi:4-hydroxy-tetrahydrodipicolinate synthase
MTLKLEGAFTALVTPFKSDLSVDDAALDKLVDAQIAGGIAGIVPCGTTGESPTLDDDEHIGVIEKTVKRANKRCVVIGGTGSNSTREAINLSKRAVSVGVDAVMIVMPYYNKPTQAGLVEHCKQVAAAVKDTPVMLYNVPGRTASDLMPESVEAICKASPNIIAIKEATGNVLRAQELHRRLGDRLTVLSGDDALTLGMMACGARGVVSVTSNIFPKEVQQVTALANAGKWEEAKRLHLALVPVHDAMFIESNPGPVKSALAAWGMIQGNVRAPLAMPTEQSRAKVQQIVDAFRANSGGAR